MVTLKMATTCAASRSLNVRLFVSKGMIYQSVGWPMGDNNKTLGLDCYSSPVNR